MTYPRFIIGRPAFAAAVTVATYLSVAGAAKAQGVEQSGSARAKPMHDTTAVRIQGVEVVSTVTGLGKSRGMSAISTDALRKAASGTSALKAVERLPGVNFQSADPWGTYEWANRVTIRGFQTQQIGQTFDGVPLGDMSYGNFNGLGIGRAVDQDNLNNASVAQGTGALGTASNNNLGGVVQYVSDDPDNRQSCRLRQMVGEAASRRTFGRFDSGLHTAGDESAWKGFLSFSRIDNDKWKGGGQRYSPTSNALIGSRGLLGRAGETYQDQINAKLAFLSGATKIVAFYDLADRKEADYADLSLARYQQSGRDWDQFSSWTVAKQFATSQTPDEAYFQSAEGARRDNLAYVAAEFGLNDRTRLTITPYYHTNRGAGDWHAPSYGSAWSPDPIYFRQTQYKSHRAGVNARLSAEVASNQIEAGVWAEDNVSTIRRVGWRLKNYDAGPDVDFSNVLRLFFDRTGDLKSSLFYLQNTNHFLDNRLSLTYGAKYLHVGADFTNNGLTEPAKTSPDIARPNVSIPTRGGLLPQVGMTYTVTGTEELFGTVSQNVNAYPYSPQTGVYNTDPKAYQYFKDHTKPEKATTYELGLRTHRTDVDASLAAFDIDYRNRLIGVAVCPLTATCVSSFANVGTVTSRGVEGLLRWRLDRTLSWTSSGSYTAATINNDYESAPGKTVHAAGKDIVDAPRILASSALNYDDGAIFGSLSGRHVAKRYFSILNDMVVPAYTTFDFGLGYRHAATRMAREVMVQLNAVNLFDQSYVSTIGTGGFTVTGDNQTLQAGSRRLLFVTVGATF